MGWKWELKTWLDEQITTEQALIDNSTDKTEQTLYEGRVAAFREVLNKYKHVQEHE